MPGATHAATFQGVPGKAQFYARIRIEDPPAIETVSHFTIAANEELLATARTGYWPKMTTRSASAPLISRITQLPGKSVRQQPRAAKKTGPTPSQIELWLKAVAAAFNDTKAEAQSNGVSIHPQLICVQDGRSNARSRALGPTANNQGSDGASWWIEKDDTPALTQLLATTSGAQVSLPNVVDLYELPGARWYRSWSPQLVLSGIGRSYKFGADGRFRADGFVDTRISGATLTNLAVASYAPVFGQDLLADPEAFNVPGLPAEVISLINEMLLLDPESSGAMAGTSSATAMRDFSIGVRATLLARDSLFAAPATQIGAILWIQFWSIPTILIRIRRSPIGNSLQAASTLLRETWKRRCLTNKSLLTSMNAPE